MSSVLQFDDKTAQRTEATYKTAEAALRRRAVLDALQLVTGERIIDIGTGPGFVAHELADCVVPTGEVFTVDMSETMLQLARTRCADQPQVRFEAGDATKLPARDSAFDVRCLRSGVRIRY